MKKIALFIICAALPAAAFAAPKDPGLFAKPENVTRVPLAPDPENPQAKAELSCFQFKDFAVKQLDRGEKGAAQLSILPLAAGEKPACTEENAANELVIEGSDWSGYFKGVKDNFVFFDADDGWNGGVGFAVFAATDGKKLFSDTARNGLRTLTIAGTALTLRYTRVYGAPCSLYADAKGCWKAIQEETGITQAQAPDCSAAYKAAVKETKGDAKQIAAVPSVIEYEVEVMLDTSTQKITAKPGKMGCRLQS
jgi:hypothetical protein